MGPWLDLLSAYATTVLYISIRKKIMRLKGLNNHFLQNLADIQTSTVRASTVR